MTPRSRLTQACAALLTMLTLAAPAFCTGRFWSDWRRRPASAKGGYVRERSGSAAAQPTPADGAKRMPVSRRKARSYRLDTGWRTRPAERDRSLGREGCGGRRGHRAAQLLQWARSSPSSPELRRSLLGFSAASASAGDLLLAGRLRHGLFLGLDLATRALRSLQPHEVTSLRTLFTASRRWPSACCRAWLS